MKSQSVFTIVSNLLESGVLSADRLGIHIAGHESMQLPLSISDAQNEKAFVGWIARVFEATEAYAQEWLDEHLS